jgi:hypothetical protein
MAVGNIHTQFYYLSFVKKKKSFVILFVLNLKFNHSNADPRRRCPCMMMKTHLVKKGKKKKLC